MHKGFYPSLRHVFLLGMLWGLSGCAGGPPIDDQPAVTSPARYFDQSVVLQSWRQDQEKRRLLKGGWQVDGSMEITVKDEVRRHRIELVGRQGSAVTIRLFGPFKNVVMEWTMVPEWLRLINANDRVTLEVAADSKGMAAMAGLAFNPAWLYPAITGCSDDFIDTPSLNGETLSGRSRSGEILAVDAATGLIKQRNRTGMDGKRFSVNYAWPAGQNLAAQPIMPERVEIRLDDDNSKLILSLKEWKFFPGRVPGASNINKPSPFPVLYPEIGDGTTP
ncbi:MAG: hypothetical protein HQL79_01505 [Magnetococcales bacterium]|nr:hypothetical protein [Magnetococcales bacterium]